MKTVTTREAQHHLTKVLQMVEAGEEVVITRRGKQIARLSSISQEANHLQALDWSEAIAQREAQLNDLPASSSNPVLAAREEERF